jgi:hypothetical protein
VGPGNFQTALSILEAKQGGFDHRREDFRSEAFAIDPIVLLTMLQENQSESTLKAFITQIATATASAVVSRTINLISQEIRFAMGGLIPRFRANGSLHSSVAIAGSGDQGIFSGLTGEIAVVAEYKIDPTINWLGTQALRRLYYQGLAFMVGCDVDIVFLITNRGYNIIYRVPAPDDPVTNLRQFNYCSYPFHDFARFDDPDQLHNFRIVLGEFARISVTPSYTQMAIRRLANVYARTNERVLRNYPQTNLDHGREELPESLRESTTRQWSAVAENGSKLLFTSLAVELWLQLSEYSLPENNEDQDLLERKEANNLG